MGEQPCLPSKIQAAVKKRRRGNTSAASTRNRRSGAAGTAAVHAAGRLPMRSAIISTTAAATARPAGLRSCGSPTPLQSNLSRAASATHWRAPSASRLKRAATRSRRSTVRLPKVFESVLSLELAPRHQMRFDPFPDWSSAPPAASRVKASASARVLRVRARDRSRFRLVPRRRPARRAGAARPWTGEMWRAATGRGSAPRRAARDLPRARARSARPRGPAVRARLSRGRCGSRAAQGSRVAARCGPGATSPRRPVPPPGGAGPSRSIGGRARRPAPGSSCRTTGARRERRDQPDGRGAEEGLQHPWHEQRGPADPSQQREEVDVELRHEVGFRAKSPVTTRRPLGQPHVDVAVEAPARLKQWMAVELRQHDQAGHEGNDDRPERRRTQGHSEPGSGRQGEGHTTTEAARRTARDASHRKGKPPRRDVPDAGAGAQRGRRPLAHVRS